MKEWIKMSAKERDRIKVLASLSEGHVSRQVAAKQLQISERQLRRIYKSYQEHGDMGVVSRLRGRQSNNHLLDEIINKAMDLTKEHYEDFGPTLVHEKLTELHGIKISKSSVRSLMIEHRIWHTRKYKYQRTHKLRERRECYGELIQMDGSYHDWFEGRMEKCCLLVMIDDATSRIGMLKFVKRETVFGYFECIKEYVNKFGIPLSVYTDRHAIFETTRGTEKNYKDTQFNRALKQLGVGLILALSPQAKGRVERANGILQDRLIKEMRLAGISSIDEANLFLPSFIEKYNQKFAKVPKNPIDAHRSLDTDMDVYRILCLHHERTISKDLMVSWRGENYQIKEKNCSNRIAKKKVKIYEQLNGEFEFLLSGKKLDYSLFKKLDFENKIIEPKWVDKKIYHPPANHPYKNWVNRA